MILPTRHISTGHSLVGVGAVVLKHLAHDQTATRLWDRVRDCPEVGNYQRFVLALDLLYLLGAIGLENGLIRRNRQ
jgi:hypothetical protein